MRQCFSHGIEANVFLFYISHELRMSVQSVVLDNLLRSGKWVICLPFQLTFNVFLYLPSESLSETFPILLSGS